MRVGVAVKAGGTMIPSVDIQTHDAKTREDLCPECIIPENIIKYKWLGQHP